MDNSCGGNPDNCVAFTAVEIVDMNIQDSAVIPGAAFDNPMQIVVVPIDTSCGGQGLEQCANGECGNEDLGGVCTCAQNYLEQCVDNTCGSLEDGSCTCEQDQLGTTCLDGTCGSLENGSCTCEQNGYTTCLDGTCGSLDDGSCTCEQDELGTTCLDGTCGSLDDGSCTCEQDELGTTCLDGTCGSLEDGSCACEQNYLFDCYGDGQCYELVEDLNNDLSITLDDCPCIGEDCEDTSSNDAIPSQFSLSAPYPNPFNPSVKIDFSLPSIDNININIYDINGEHVDNIMSGFKTAGFYTAYWNASSMPTGIYFISFSSKEVNRTMKVVLVK